MLVILLFIAAVALFDVAAIRGGADTRYGFDSSEYDRHRSWLGTWG